MKHIFLLIGLFFTLLQGVEAKTYRTIASGNWDDASTWEGGQIPPKGIGWDMRNPNKTVIITKGDSVYSSTGDITVSSPCTLNVEGTLYTMNTLRVNTGGTVNVSGRFLINNKVETAWTGTVTINEGAYMGVSGGFSNGAGADTTNDGVLNIGDKKPWWGAPIKGKGRTTWNHPNPLPIELKSFVASASQGIARFVWVTASEKNNDYFTIEQSSDLKNWETIHRQQGAGNSFSELSYKAEKKLKGIGIFYFRLKQTDYDGQFSYSKIVSLSNNTLNEELPSAFSENGEIVIRNTYEHLQVFNTQGKLLGTYSQIYRLNDLPKGILVFVFDKQHKQKIVNY